MELKNIIKFEKYSYNTSKVAVIDPYDFDHIYLLEDKTISKKKAKDAISKDTLISTYLPAKNVILYELEIPKNLVDKVNLDDYIETKCYEELDLDEAEKYVFKYKLVSSINNEKNFITEVVIAQENSAIKEYFSDLYEKYNYIDYIGYSGFLFEVLYKKEILEKRKDIFMFFTKNHVLITLYADGEFLQNIILNDGLYSLYERLENSNLSIVDLDYELFLNILIRKGLDPDNYDYGEEILFNQLGEIFSNLFMVIINQLNSLKRKFSLSTLDRMFISTETGSVPGILDFTNIYLGGVIVKELKFDKKYNPENIQINQLLFLNMLSTSYAYENEYHNFNFTLKKRPPTFFYRKSGQLISITALSIILSSIYPIYEYIDYYIKKSANEKNILTVNKLNDRYKKLNYIFDTKLKIYEQKKKLLNKKIIYINSIEEIITKLYNYKNKYTPISKLLTIITPYMKQLNIYAKSINLDKGILTLEIFSKDEANITNFINKLIQKHNFIIETKGIIKEKENYSSIINIKVNL
jgi:hypothetical protein